MRRITSTSTRVDPTEFDGNTSFQTLAEDRGKPRLCYYLGYSESSCVTQDPLPADLAKIKRQAREQHRSLRDYCQDEIIGPMVLAEFE